MPKPKKRSRADAAESSGARSKKLYSAHLAEDLRSELRGWPKPDRARVGKLIQRVQENFGNPHLHSGTGIRDLSPKGSRLSVYECRIGRDCDCCSRWNHRHCSTFTPSATTMKYADS